MTQDAGALLESVTDELLAHGEFSSGANNRSNARIAAEIVINMVRQAASQGSAGGEAVALLKLADELEWLALASNKDFALHNGRGIMTKAAIAIRQVVSQGNAGGEQSEVQTDKLTPEQVYLINDMIHAWIDPEKKGEFRQAFRNDCKQLLATSTRAVAQALPTPVADDLLWRHPAPDASPSRVSTGKSYTIQSGPHPKAQAAVPFLCPCCGARGTTDGKASTVTSAQLGCGDLNCKDPNCEYGK